MASEFEALSAQCLDRIRMSGALVQGPGRKMAANMDPPGIPPGFRG
jgi:hypothetical protein